MGTHADTDIWYLIGFMLLWGIACAAFLIIWVLRSTRAGIRAHVATLPTEPPPIATPVHVRAVVPMQPPVDEQMTRDLTEQAHRARHAQPTGLITTSSPHKRHHRVNYRPGRPPRV